MKDDIKALEKMICHSLCAKITVQHASNGLLRVSTPFEFDDGDEYSVYLERLSSGGYKITDRGNTIMRMSYTMDTEALFIDGNREKIFRCEIEKADLNEDNGELFLFSVPEQLGPDIIRFGNCLTKLHSITFLNRARSESSFYADLHRKLVEFCPPKTNLQEEVSIDSKGLYVVDHVYSGPSMLKTCIFGISTTEKAKHATIILAHLNFHSGWEFNSLIVFESQEKIARPALARLTDQGGETVSSLDEEETLRRKISKLSAA